MQLCKVIIMIANKTRKQGLCRMFLIQIGKLFKM